MQASFLESDVYNRVFLLLEVFHSLQLVDVYLEETLVEGQIRKQL